MKGVTGRDPNSDDKVYLGVYNTCCVIERMDHYGFKAAAVAIMAPGYRSLRAGPPPELPKFIADRPYIFLIMKGNDIFFSCFIRGNNKEIFAFAS